jgi:Lrp/AsnC family transcriptional regulator, leucine-responsive regulatory protein
MLFGEMCNMTEGFSAIRPRSRPLDQIDTVLLGALQEQGRLRLEDLARRVELSPSSVHDRLRRLERDGVIRNWTITVAPEALGLTVLAFVGVRASRPCAELIEPLARIHEIEEYHSVAGPLSFLVKLRASSTEHLLELIEQLKQIPGIDSTETTVVLKTYLERGPQVAP